MAAPPSVPPHGSQALSLQGSHDHVDVVVASAQEAAMGIQPGVWGQPEWEGAQPGKQALLTQDPTQQWEGDQTVTRIKGYANREWAT